MYKICEQETDRHYRPFLIVKIRHVCIHWHFGWPLHMHIFMCIIMHWYPSNLWPKTSVKCCLLIASSIQMLLVLKFLCFFHNLPNLKCYRECEKLAGKHIIFIITPEQAELTGINYCSTLFSIWQSVLLFVFCALYGWLLEIVWFSLLSLILDGMQRSFCLLILQFNVSDCYFFLVIIFRKLNSCIVQLEQVILLHVLMTSELFWWKFYPQRKSLMEMLNATKNCKLVW